LKYLKFSSGFYSFTFLNVLDKLVAYITPLLLLHFFNNNSLYNTIEFVYSIALIINIFIDFGTRGYMTYSFRFHKNKKEYTFSIIKLFNLLLIIYVICFSLITFFLNKFSFIDLAIIYFVFIRAIYLCIINIYRVFFRLNTNPAYIFAWSIPIQIFTIFIIMMFYLFDREINLNYFFLPTLIFLFFYVLRLIIKNEIDLNFSSVINLFIKSIKYYWALIISSSISIIIGNYAKVYSFVNLTDLETTKISFLLRTLMIIQLIHGSYTAFNLKNIFSNSKKDVSKKLFLNYLILMGIFSLLVILIIPTYSNYLNLNFKLDLIFVNLYLYVLFWCIAAYFEQYINKFNKNIFILYNYLISVFVYFAVILYYENITLFSLSIAMSFSSMIYLILTIIRIKKLGIKIG
jgi:hypothetical protein